MLKNKKEASSIYESAFFIVPTYITKLPDITWSFIKVYETIFQFWNHGKQCYLSNPAISERTGVGERQVKEALTFFERGGELLRQSIGLKRYLTQPERRIETTQRGAPAPSSLNNTQVGAPAPQGRRSSALEVGAPAPHKNKKLNKEINNNNKNIKDMLEPIKSSQHNLPTNYDVIECATQETTEANDMAIISNEYQDTYFKQEEPKKSNVLALTPKDDDRVVSYALSLSVEQQKKIYDIPISFEQSLSIAQKQVSGADGVGIRDIINALLWWNLYPVKQNYRKWLASWFAEGCHKKHQEMLLKLDEQLENDQRMKDGYVPNPSSYILDARYDDKIYQQPKPKSAINHNDTSWADPSRRNIFETW